LVKLTPDVIRPIDSILFQCIIFTEWHRIFCCLKHLLRSRSNFVSLLMLFKVPLGSSTNWVSEKRYNSKLHFVLEYALLILRTTSWFITLLIIRGHPLVLRLSLILNFVFFCNAIVFIFYVRIAIPGNRTLVASTAVATPSSSTLNRRAVAIVDVKRTSSQRLPNTTKPPLWFE